MRKNMWWRHNFFDDVITKLMMSSEFRYDYKSVINPLIYFVSTLKWLGGWILISFYVFLPHINIIFADISKKFKFKFLAVEKSCDHQILHTGSMWDPLYVKLKIFDYTCKTTSSPGRFLSKTKMCWRQHNMAAIMDFCTPTCKYQYHLPICQVWWQLSYYYSWNKQLHFWSRDRVKTMTS